MSRIAPLVVALAVGIPALSQVAQACGDKFLMVGKGARFQKAYASVYPGNIYIYARPSTSAKAAIRDPKLHKALRQAGHRVSVIEDWSLLEHALKTVAVDAVLVDVAEAAKLQPILASSAAHPEALYVRFTKDAPPSATVCRLKSSDGPIQFLDVIEDAMKARSKKAKAS